MIGKKMVGKDGRKKVEVCLRPFFDILEKQGFPFSYGEVEKQDRLYGPLDETHVQTNFDNSLSNGANQSALGQILFEL